jgi:hypothetical protein
MFSNYGSPPDTLLIETSAIGHGSGSSEVAAHLHCLAGPPSGLPFAPRLFVELLLSRCQFDRIVLNDESLERIHVPAMRVLDIRSRLDTGAGFAWLIKTINPK